jgi:hypothetical protein
MTDRRNPEGQHSQHRADFGAPSRTGKMIARIVKIIALVIATPIVLLVLGVIYVLIAIETKYRNAEITTALVRDGIYEPARHFKFDRACLVGPESIFLEHGYAPEVDTFPLPDTFVRWTLVLINESNKTYRTLYAREPVVHLGRLGCVPKITLRTEIRNRELTAYVEEDYAPSPGPTR